MMTPECHTKVNTWGQGHSIYCLRFALISKVVRSLKKRQGMSLHTHTNTPTHLNLLSIMSPAPHLLEGPFPFSVSGTLALSFFHTHNKQREAEREGDIVLTEKETERERERERSTAWRIFWNTHTHRQKISKDLCFGRSSERARIIKNCLGWLERPGYVVTKTDTKASTSVFVNQRREITPMLYTHQRY